MIEDENRSQIKNKVPPDGGYGWIIALAMALTQSIHIPMMQSFGLIYKDTFAELHLSAAETSLIINLHAAFGMLTGMLNGVLVKTFGYRKIAFLAAFFYFSGVTLTSFAQKFVHFVLTWGMLASLGTGMCRSSYSLALNTYFKKKRSRALSFAVTITALGSILIPQLITLLLKFYTTEGVMLILAGICSHLFLTALLLQPVKRYMKPPEDLETIDNSKRNAVVQPKRRNILGNIVNFFDLDLLKDPIFVNILIGMAFAVFSELNFTVLTPFILNEYGLTTNQIATFMSTTATVDIVFRMLAPYIGEFFKLVPRNIFLITLVLLMIMRYILLMSSGYYACLMVAAGLGLARGIRRVYVGLIIPGHVSLERLPSASGMEHMANGFCILAGGAILGFVRDMTGSYSTCIIIMNCVTAIPVILWSLEAVILRQRRKKRRNKG